MCELGFIWHQFYLCIASAAADLFIYLFILEKHIQKINLLFWNLVPGRHFDHFDPFFPNMKESLGAG